uniref:Myb-like domain-containing protein n=1 Tax=Rhodosorus marinus TaxID=101924 RepID=A0A7S0G1Q6_9RHOD|mmetsp:Transcript_20592/g.29857  ORF Transcript_20592/g.29857 Transcript_20592/m.29857 type:complete len:437 (+) Transcript_20592:328-1638(+)|eukprot:CAMPEP_0184741476 /NCGR_PEP_ID=MMETSP0315-20130426/4507_1 /TAXON_ID=101924 /ORGANISM="Rhodosorus marinus, Strain UTEX LB 2760" /LENGTH=436 /DNA_ID=CAMNT_0027211793 /DNA_START=269 /DNA_END=1579 /DNA_ORIENTATION=+
MLGTVEDILDDEHRVAPFEEVDAGLSFAEENQTGYSASSFGLDTEIVHADAGEPILTSPASEPLDTEDMCSADMPVERGLDSAEVFFYAPELSIAESYPEMGGGETPAPHAEENLSHVAARSEAPPVVSEVNPSSQKLHGENGYGAGVQSGSRNLGVHDGAQRRATRPHFPLAEEKLSVGIVSYPTTRKRQGAPKFPMSPGGTQDSNEGQDARGKKKRLIWTSKLHNCFLEAIRFIGINNAGPKNVLERMKIRGITTEHVKSHLQKYRNNLKKDAAQETRAPVMGPVNVVARQGVHMHPLVNNLPTHTPQLQYTGGMVNQNGAELMQQHSDWQAEVHDRTMRCLLQMQMNQNIFGSLQRKFHVSLERMKPLQGQYSQQHVDELFRENERLMKEHSQVQKELTRQHAELRDLVDEAERLRQSYFAYGHLQMPIQQAP